MEKVNLFAFWEYDTYPYILGATVSKIREDGLVYADSYLGWFRPVVLLPADKGTEMNQLLTALGEEYKDAEKKLKKEYTDMLLKAFPFHPYNKKK